MKRPFLVGFMTFKFSFKKLSLPANGLIMNYQEIKNREFDKQKDFINRAEKVEFGEPSVNKLLKREKGKFVIDPVLLKLISESKDKKAIYIFEFAGKTNYIRLVDAFSNNRVKEERGSDKVYHVSKFNGECVRLNSTIIYVGSKEKDLLQRIKQHLGVGQIKSRSVYSLYLNDWWPGRMPVRIKIWFFPKETEPEVLQLTEDALWEGLFPLFGKKGATFNKKRIIP